MALIGIAAAFAGCGAGDDMDNDVTCTEVGQIEAACQKLIQGGEAAYDEDFAVAFAEQCEIRASLDCLRCVMDSPCIPAPEPTEDEEAPLPYTPYGFCVAEGKCLAIEFGEE
ncbi:MAG: hypothetical protein C4523_11270 [Myxococcales bacterium]|nr:MAG: hypothetical protein C4523_11270 [Myxococcales bacterium]